MKVNSADASNASATEAGGSDEYARRVAREIEIFAAHDALHQHGAAFHRYTARAVAPLTCAAFGRSDLYEIYAESLSAAAARTGLPVVYSLGCGDGAQERAVLRAADRLGLPPFRIIGLEIAPTVVERANAAASAEGLSGRMVAVVHDINRGLPEGGDFTAFMAHQVLHHFVTLEALFDEIAARLHPEGVFVTFDMIGRNGHMRWPEVRPLVRHIWSQLPPGKRYDGLFEREMPWFQEWDCSIEGFEGVRAQDILRLLAERFTPSRFIAWGGVADIFVSPRFASNFDMHNSADGDFIDSLSDLETRLLATRATTPASMGAEFRSRRSGSAPDSANASRLARALRQPGEVFPPIEGGSFVSPYAPRPAPTVPVLDTGKPSCVAASEPAGAALREGWILEDNGAWALLDEQFLHFRTAEPVRSVSLTAFNALPTHRRQMIHATAEGCRAVWSCPIAWCRSAMILGGLGHRVRLARPRA